MGAKALKPQFRGRVNPRGVMVVRNIRLMRYYIPSRTGYLNLQHRCPLPLHPLFALFLRNIRIAFLSLSPFPRLLSFGTRLSRLPALFVVFNRRFLRCRAKNSHSRRIISNTSALRTFRGKENLYFFEKYSYLLNAVTFNHTLESNNIKGYN